MLRKKIKSESGISLLEVSIMMLVAGVILATVLRTMTTIRNNEARFAYYETTELIADELLQYALIHGHYPAPASPTLNVTDPNYGLSLETADLPPFADCGTGTAVNGVICALGQRDLDNPANGIDTKETVMIGVLPVATLGLDRDKTRDFNGMRFTYAVTTVLLNADTFAHNSGVIGVDSSEVGAGGALGTNNDVHFVVVGHGTNQAGAYRDDGTRNPCGSGLSPIEAENCDDDAVFTALTQPNTEGEPNRSLAKYVLDNGGEYYDDSIYFVNSANLRIWTPIGSENIHLTSGDSEEQTRLLLGATSFSESPVNDLRHSFQGPHAHPQAWINGDARAERVIGERICDQGQDFCFLVGEIVSASAADSTFRCLERGFRRTKLSTVTLPGNWIEKAGQSTHIQGECDPQTNILDPAPLIGANSQDPNTGVVCPEGMDGIDGSGQFICK